jgi:flagellar biosynthesis anti-sigma factor FlgM
MIINNNLQGIVGAYQVNSNNAGKRVQGQNSPSFKDEVRLSQSAETFRSAMKKLKNMGEVEVREDKVSFYTNAIESGNYSVSAANIASKMLMTRV